MSDAKETAKKNDWNEKFGKKDGKKAGKKGLIIGIVVAAVFIVAAIGIFNKLKQGMQAAKDALGDGAIVDEYGKKDMSTYVDVTGTVESQEVVNVTTSLSYPIDEIKVEVGDHVKKGDVLCKINTDDIDEKIEALEAQASDEDRMKAKELESAAHSVNAAAGSKNRAVNEAGRAIEGSKAEYDAAVAEYNTLKEAYDTAVAERTAYAAAKKEYDDAMKAKQETTEAPAPEEEAPVEGETPAECEETTEAPAPAPESTPEPVAPTPPAMTDKEFAALELEYQTAAAKVPAAEAAYNQASGSYNDTVAAAAEGYQTAKDQSDLTVISNTQSYSQISVELANCYKDKNDAVIIAETSGIVTSINATEGLPANGAIMTIENDEKLKMDVDVKEKDIFSVKEGMTVEFSNSSLTNVNGTGKVDKVIQFATTGAPTTNANGQVSAGDNAFKATLTIDNYKDVLLGMKLKARIATGEELTTEAVPYTAIMSDVDGDYVYVAEPAGNGMYMVTRKSIEKGMSGDYYTEVTGGDLEEGDLVIAYPSTVTENSVITIREEDKDSDKKESSDSKDKEGSDTEDKKDTKDSKDKDEK
ncbi:MAG: efflux RND transporter periplasmic adaptor subunit [Eubacterium sp.]|nr:efflux RND transporter periplasmic adaptor subunit [Eubacterium sp.]